MTHTATIILAASERLSQQDVVRAIRENWHTGPHAVWLLVGFIIGLIALLGYVYLRHRPKGEADDRVPTAIFAEAASMLAVTPRDRRLLTRISRQQALSSPLTLLLSPRTLRVHASAFAAKRSRWARLRLLQRIARVRRAMRQPQ